MEFHGGTKRLYLCDTAEQIEIDFKARYIHQAKYKKKPKYIKFTAKK